MAKSMRNEKTGEIIRVSDDEALKLFRSKQGWRYISKSEGQRLKWQAEQKAAS